MECYYCQKELPKGSRIKVEGPWGKPTGDLACEPCAEKQFDDYMEASVF